MNVQMLLDELTAAGFTFAVGGDGHPTFTVPNDDGPNTQELYMLLAWHWADLSPLVARSSAAAG